jgi:hypothetical protein
MFDKRSVVYLELVEFVGGPCFLQIGYCICGAVYYFSKVGRLWVYVLDKVREGGT